jgi:hypothetical protein
MQLSHFAIKDRLSKSARKKKYMVEMGISQVEMAGVETR